VTDIERLQQLQSILQPPAFVPTEQEHRIAYLTCVLNNVFDYLFEFNFYKKIENKPDLAERALHRLINNTLGKAEKNDEKEHDWEYLLDYEEFKTSWGGSLSEMHGGDCTFFSGPCVRCHAEAIYSLKNSATWKDGREGNSLHSEYSTLEEKVKK
jgi:hypothetical protein